MGPYPHIRNTHRDDMAIIRRTRSVMSNGIKMPSDEVSARDLRITIIPKANYASQVVHTPQKLKTNRVISPLAGPPDTGSNRAFVPR